MRGSGVCFVVLAVLAACSPLNRLSGTRGVTVGAGTVWEGLSEWILDHNPALGDAYALATAAAVGGTVLIGGEDDYDEVSSVPLILFQGRGIRASTPSAQPMLDRRSARVKRGLFKSGQKNNRYSLVARRGSVTA